MCSPILPHPFKPRLTCVAPPRPATPRHAPPSIRFLMIDSSPYTSFSSPVTHPHDFGGTPCPPQATPHSSHNYQEDFYNFPASCVPLIQNSAIKCLTDEIVTSTVPRWPESVEVGQQEHDIKEVRSFSRTGFLIVGFFVHFKRAPSQTAPRFRLQTASREQP